MNNTYVPVTPAIPPADHPLTSWVFWIYFLCWLPYVICLVMYGFRSPWRSSSIGRGLMTLFATTVAVLSNGLLALLWDNYELRDVVRLVTLGGAALAGWFMVKNVWQLQAEGRRLRRQAEMDAALAKPPAQLDDDGLATR